MVYIWKLDLTLSRLVQSERGSKSGEKCGASFIQAARMPELSLTNNINGFSKHSRAENFAPTIRQTKPFGFQPSDGINIIFTWSQVGLEFSQAPDPDVLYL